MSQAQQITYEIPSAEAMRPPRVPNFGATTTDSWQAGDPFLDAQLRSEAHRMGVWLFLAAETVLFAGPFSAYAVLRAARPEVFAYGAYFMNSNFGALLTGSLLASALAAALASRAAEHGHAARMRLTIAAALGFGLVFAAGQFADVREHVAHGHLPGKHFHPVTQVWETARFSRRHPESARYAHQLQAESAAAAHRREPPSARQREPAVEDPLVQAGVLGERSLLGSTPSMPPNAHVYFGVYWLVTGLHLLHVLAGIAIWSFLLWATRARTGAPPRASVERASLYWQFVTIVWLFVYPLYYLA